MRVQRRRFPLNATTIEYLYGEHFVNTDFRDNQLQQKYLYLGCVKFKDEMLMNIAYATVFSFINS